MSRVDERPTRRISARGRLASALSAVGLLALLAVAGRLEPNPSGMGTHQQLGLPPCTLRTLTGRPCPTCGMTTAWSHLVRGEPLEALQTNAAGTLLGLAAIAAVPWTLLSAVRGQWLLRPPCEIYLMAFALSLLAVMLLDWLRRLVV